MGKIEIELVIHDDKGLRVDAIGIPVGETPSSVAAILRRKFLRIIGKHVPVLGAGELPNGVFPAMGKFQSARHRLFSSEIGNAVITLNGDIVGRRVNLATRFSFGIDCDPQQGQ